MEGALRANTLSVRGEGATEAKSPVETRFAHRRV
jgi:hypothetical protein